MKIKQSVLTISDDNPFAEALPGRKEIAESLSRLIESVEDPFVLAIDAGWGAGKTTFLKMWQRQLAHDASSKCIYFSAWENDFAEDPLVSLIGELTAELAKLRLKGNPDEAAEAIIDDVKKKAGKVLQLMIPVGIKILSAGILEAADIGLDPEVLAKASEDYAKKKIEEYEANKKTLSGFRETLEKFAKSLRKENNDNPLIFIIDELDRCRPAYAVALLERLKHLFSVPGICFVLAIDRLGLLASIKAQYGSELNAEGYLRRFIDLDYYLPDPEIEPFLQMLCKQFELEKLPSISDRYSMSTVLNGWPQVCRSLGLKLRDVEQCFARFVLILRIAPQIDPMQDFVLLPFVLALRFCEDSPLHRRLSTSLVSAEILLGFLSRTEAGKLFRKSNESAYLEVCLIAALDGEAALKALSDRLNALRQTGNDGDRNRTEMMINAIEEISPARFYRQALSTVFANIEFANGFGSVKGVAG